MLRPLYAFHLFIVVRTINFLPEDKYNEYQLNEGRRVQQSSLLIETRSQSTQQRDLSFVSWALENLYMKAVLLTLT